MTYYVNVGAKLVSDDSDIPTKKALKALIAANPANVLLYSTEAIGPNQGKADIASATDIGVRYSVTGPNPYTSRKWYATVEKLPNGTITVK